MPSFESTIQNNQPLLNVQVSTPNSSLPNSSAGFVALLDTGAQVTSLSPKVPQALGLIQIGIGTMIPASGQSINVPKFHVRIDIPIATNVQLKGGGQYQSAYLQGKNMDVFQLPFQPSNYDVLIGMDFISLFHITLFRGRFILSN